VLAAGAVALIGATGGVVAGTAAQAATPGGTGAPAGVAGADTTTTGTGTTTTGTATTATGTTTTGAGTTTTGTGAGTTTTGTGAGTTTTGTGTTTTGTGTTTADTGTTTVETSTTATTTGPVTTTVPATTAAPAASAVTTSAVTGTAAATPVVTSTSSAAGGEPKLIAARSTGATRTSARKTTTSTTGAKTTKTATAKQEPTSLRTVTTESTGTAVGDVWDAGVGDADNGTLSILSEFSGVLNGDAKPPKKLVPLYRAAASRYHVPWQILAAINAMETDYGRDLRTSSAGAIGWMQFMPATWKEYGVEADGATANPDNAHDAIFAAAKLLSVNGGEQHLRRAIFAYNHADWYVDEVVFVAAQIVGDETSADATAQARIRTMQTTAKLLSGTPYVWGGGHAGWEVAAGYDCSGFVSAVLHGAGYLEQPATTQTLPAEQGIESGPGRWVTIFDRTDAGSITDDHVIIDVDGQWWESGGSSADGGAGNVHRIAAVSSSYLATFNRILHPEGL
jgi:hypothetical protein